MRLAVPRNPTRRPDDAAAPALAARARRARLRVAAAALVVFALGWGLSQNVPLDPFATVGPGPSPSPSGAGTAAPGGAPSGSSTGAADRSVPAVPGAPLVAAPSGAVAPAAGPPVARPLNVRNGPVVLSGTLLLPSGPGPFPAVVLLPGRGASARDQAAADARLFATHGIAAYAYDKRGAGGSTGDWRSSLALNDEVGDAVAAVAAVRRQPGIDPSRVGVWGLGQGAWLAPFVGEHADVAFLILLNSSAAPLGQEEVWNAGDAVRARGYSPTAADAAMRAVRLLVSTRPVLAALLPHDQLGFLKDVPASNPADALHRAKGWTRTVLESLGPGGSGPIRLPSATDTPAAVPASATGLAGSGTGSAYAGSASAGRTSASGAPPAGDPALLLPGTSDRSAPWYASPWVQLGAVVFFLIAFGEGLVLSVLPLGRRRPATGGHGASPRPSAAVDPTPTGNRAALLLRVTQALVSLVDLALLAGTALAVAFLLGLYQPPGLALTPLARSLRALSAVSGALAVALAVLILAVRRSGARPPRTAVAVVVAVAAALFLPFLVFWHVPFLAG
ncbi:MAG: alpha/beta hydrolase [Deinococcales bacterium]